MRRSQFFNDRPRTDQTPRSIQDVNIFGEYSACSNFMSCDGLSMVQSQSYFMDDSSDYSGFGYQLSPAPSSQGNMSWSTCSAPAPDFPFEFNECYGPSTSSPTDTDYKEDWHMEVDPSQQYDNLMPPSCGMGDIDFLQAQLPPSPVHSHASFGNDSNGLVRSSSSDTSAVASPGVAGIQRPERFVVIKREIKQEIKQEVKQEIMQDIKQEIMQEPERDCSPPCVHSEETLESPSAGNRFSNEPYSKLIYRALMGAPCHSMALQEIYLWFLKNTNKVKPGQEGWKNSIRHNLSMNAAFMQLCPKTLVDETKKNSIWILDRRARHNGVEPTTRYRENTGKVSKTKSKKLGGSHGSRAGRSTSKVKHEKLSQACMFAPRSCQPSGYGYDRQSSMLPDTKLFSPLTPPAFESMPISDAYYRKPIQSPYINDVSHPDFGFDLGFVDVAGVWSDDSQVLLGREDGMSSVPQWTGGLGY